MLVAVIVPQLRAKVTPLLASVLLSSERYAISKFYHLLSPPWQFHNPRHGMSAYVQGTVPRCSPSGVVVNVKHSWARHARQSVHVQIVQ